MGIFDSIIKVGKALSNMEKVQLSSKVKRANTRLRALESKGLDRYSSAYKSLKELYDMEENQGLKKNERLTYRTSNGEIKFNTSINKLSRNKMAGLDKYVDAFLNAETSTIKGSKEVKRIIDKSYDSFINDKDKPLRQNYTRQEYEDIWDHTVYEKMMSSGFSSESAYEMTVEVMRQNISQKKLITLINQNIRDDRVLLEKAKYKKKSHNQKKKTLTQKEKDQFYEGNSYFTSNTLLEGNKEESSKAYRKRRNKRKKR